MLYCGVKDDSGRLQEAADSLVERFVQSGLMRREHERVKLHCTILNSKFRREEAEGEVGEGRGERETFDGRPLLERWGEVVLGEVAVEEVHLSVRRAGRRSAMKGYYLPSHVLRLGQAKQ